MQLVRLLYETEVQYLVHYAQSAALGSRVQSQDCKGIDWENMDPEGNSLRKEMLEELEKRKDPADVMPPGKAPLRSWGVNALDSIMGSLMAM